MKSYWDKYYNKFLPPSKPTAFAIYCKNFLKNYHNTLLDIGCGNEGIRSILISLRLIVMGLIKAIKL